MTKNVFLSLVFLCSWILGTTAQPFVVEREKEAQKAWVDSIYNGLNERQKIAQMFMMAAYSNLNEEHYSNLDEVISKFNVGGLLFLQGGPGRQINLINRFQQQSATPLLIGMDVEYGLGMRLDSIENFPKQLTLGAIKNEQYLYNLGSEMARQLKIVGVHLNISPSLDIYNNPANPGIGWRSYGEDKLSVSRKGTAFFSGLNDNGIIASAKHFPGLGDTERDSHFRLPLSNHNSKRLQEIELYPFKSLFDKGLMSVTVGHIKVPAIDDQENLPSSLSNKVVDELLKQQLQFKGLVITDMMNAKSVTRHYPAKEANLMAIMAGNDMLLAPEDIEETIELVLNAVSEGTISWDRLEKSVKKVLMAKYWAGLNNQHPINDQLVLDRLNTPTSRLLHHKLYEKAITVVKNNKGAIPIKSVEINEFASLSIGGDVKNTFQDYLQKYVNFDQFHISRNESDPELYNALYDSLKNYGTVVIGIHELSNSAHNNFSVNEGYLNFIYDLQKQTEVIVVVFGNPYSLHFFEDLDHIICAYEENEYSMMITPQIIFGALASDGKLPVSPSRKLKIHQGVETKPLGRLAYSVPEDVGFDSEVLKRIDLIAEEAITEEATPGCQILVAKNGAIVYEKSYGYFTYDKSQSVSNQTVYDLASLTKVLATLQSIMFLQDQGLLDVNQKASYYLQDLKGTNKENMVIKDILMHQAGLLSFIPFWAKTVNDQGLNQEIYNHNGGGPFNLEISNNLYGKQSLQDSLWTWIKNSDLRPLRRNRTTFDYKYSDLGFYIMHRIAESLLNQKMDEFLAQNFYSPLGMNFMTFLPLKKYSKNNIAPTEFDNYFRNDQIQGTVHDPGAAMMGGVSGHAGVFGNANDIAKILQMNLQNGIYGGIQYFQPGTVRRFTSRQIEDNRRGLGWDKPELSNDHGPTSLYSSPETYGHTGFTGTAAWVDPSNDLIYIFLSNRIYPNANNFKLIKNNIRTRIQDIIYQAIIN